MFVSTYLVASTFQDIIGLGYFTTGHRILLWNHSVLGEYSDQFVTATCVDNFYRKPTVWEAASHDITSRLLS